MLSFTDEELRTKYARIRADERRKAARLLRALRVDAMTQVAKGDPVVLDLLLRITHGIFALAAARLEAGPEAPAEGRAE